MRDEKTTIAVEHYLNELAVASEDTPAETIVRALLAKSVDRLHLLCSTMLFQHYPRLTRPPLNLESDEMLSAVVERMIKALRQIRPSTPRQFFALANQHVRWELNDLARKLDAQAQAVTLHESAMGLAEKPESSNSQANPNIERILETIDSLPEEERETFYLVRVQGMGTTDAAVILGVSARTVQRRMTRTLQLLANQLRDLRPSSLPPTA